MLSISEKSRKLQLVHAYDLQACSKAHNSGKAMQPTSVILNVTLMIVFVAFQAPHCGTSFNQQSVSALFLYFFRESSWCGWEEKSQKCDP